MAHITTLVRVANNHGYPHRAQCSCGWSSRGYVAPFAAQIMADDHVEKAGQ